MLRPRIHSPLPAPDAKGTRDHKIPAWSSSWRRLRRLLFRREEEKAKLCQQRTMRRPRGKHRRVQGGGEQGGIQSLCSHFYVGHVLPTDRPTAWSVFTEAGEGGALTAPATPGQQVLEHPKWRLGPRHPLLMETVPSMPDLDSDMSPCGPGQVARPSGLLPSHELPGWGGAARTTGGNKFTRKLLKLLAFKALPQDHWVHSLPLPPSQDHRPPTDRLREVKPLSQGHTARQCSASGADQALQATGPARD